MTDPMTDPMDTVEWWEEWSNGLAELLPEDAETWPGVNPEGAQESIITAALAYLVRHWEATEEALADVRAILDDETFPRRAS